MLIYRAPAFTSLVFLIACGAGPQNQREADAVAAQIDLFTGYTDSTDRILASLIEDDEVTIEATYPGGDTRVESNIETVLRNIEGRLFVPDELGLPLSSAVMATQIEDQIALAIDRHLPMQIDLERKIREYRCVLDFDIDAQFDDLSLVDFTLSSMAYSTEADEERARIVLTLNDLDIRAKSDTDISIGVSGRQWPHCYLGWVVDPEIDGALRITAPEMLVTIDMTFSNGESVCEDGCCAPRLNADVALTDVHVDRVDFDGPDIVWETRFGDFNLGDSNVWVSNSEVTDAVQAELERLDDIDFGSIPVETGILAATDVSFDEDGFLFDWGDADDDGFLDCDDNCPDDANPDQDDLDGDDFGDVCDGDDDDDWHADDSDNCPRIFNRNQRDQDGDGLGDVCDDDLDGDGWDNDEDGCPHIHEDFQIDSDGDGRNNNCDNCPSTYNPGQENLDRDAYGDACDDDRDGDGVKDTEDNCPDDSNPDQTDDDENGIGVMCDDEEMADAMRGWIESLREELADKLIRVPESRYLPEWGPSGEPCFDCAYSKVVLLNKKRAVEPIKKALTEALTDDKAIFKDKLGKSVLDPKQVDKILAEGLKLEIDELEVWYKTVEIDPTGISGK